MIVAKWREGYGFYKGIDPQKVAEEIRSIGDNVSTVEIVNRARDANSELHKCFEWDDSIAAEKYRMVQARHIVHNLVIEENEIPTDRPELRMFYKPSASDGYKETIMIYKDEDEYSNLLKRAYAELRAFKLKYSMLQELEEIMNLIN